MSRQCMHAGCRAEAVMRWQWVTPPMLPAWLDICEKHIREALDGSGKLRAALLAIFDVTCDTVAGNATDAVGT